MDRKFILSCGSTVDMPYSYMEQRDIPVIFYSCVIDGKVCIDDMCRDPQALPDFYAKLAAGALPSTSQVNEYAYLDFFEELLQKGDLLHVAFGSGMTPSVNNAMKAADILREKYPQRKLVVVDSTCSSSGYGLFVDTAADMRDRGCTIEETEQWLLENRWYVHHHFFSTDLKYFKRSGRVSGATATIAAILDICPIMRLDEAGKIVAYDKVRGKHNAIRRTVDTMEKHAVGGRDYSGKCFLSHSNCLAEAELTRDTIEARFPNLAGKVRIYDIGRIIASHCGPGTVSLYFMGDKRS